MPICKDRGSSIPPIDRERFDLLEIPESTQHQTNSTTALFDSFQQRGVTFRKAICMYNIYTFPTPNGIKVPIALEELNLEYKLHPVNIRQGGQREADFVAVNPAGKVPVLVEENTTGDRFTLTESAAILVFLAEKHGQLLPTEPIDRARVFEQLFFHASGLSPAFGQSGYFQKLAPEPMPLAISRFHGEAKRTLGLLDRTLAQHPYVAGDNYSVADIAHFGWLWRRAFAGVDFDEFPNVARWYESIAARPAVLRAIAKVEALAA